ncbi:hypothetical protein H9C73_06060 [Marinobacterium sp. AK62]|uniref:Uncharacterized protein n=1 Tax=Marinobacterium alkalitolerans TaxID=1542925 RepID=A0ABS3Z9B1_9GAMM|nr:hypothetical protein [Marinobacterium alkalitolerans]MBP0048293.1 hypothetical protein [Marinobacterium alkalitolerans]
MKSTLNMLGAYLILGPTLIVFCYVLRPLLALILIPGGLLLLLVITRGDVWPAIYTGLFESRPPKRVSERVF